MVKFTVNFYNIFSSPNTNFHLSLFHSGSSIAFTPVLFKLPQNCTHLASKIMLKILQARLQQYVNHELPDVQAGFRKGRGTSDQIANIHWVIKKKQESS